MTFLNLISSEESGGNYRSYCNEQEVLLALNLFLTLRQSFDPSTICGNVGIITPYSDQLSLLKKLFRRDIGDDYGNEVEINTVDGFQGREKDIIIC